MSHDKDFRELREMWETFSNYRKEILPSKYWMVLNQKNINQLKEQGYVNFKRTIAQNYFTWIIKSRFWKDDQIKYLFFHLPINLTMRNIIRAVCAIFLRKSFKFLNLQRSLIYNFLVYRLWDFASRNDPEHILDKFKEPYEGNPPSIFLKKQLISQDLANAAIEYHSIMSNISKKEINSIMELGAGYGRTAYVFLKQFPEIKYFIVDIPPALYIAKKYLSNQFRKRKIFKYRNFLDYTKIKKEIGESNIIFLMPNQLELLPSKMVDLFINISSFQEMRFDQIQFYFNCIDRLVKKYLYIKQWKVSKIP